MSVESSEIITAMTTMLRQQLTDLHNQNINEIQAIVSRLDERLIVLQLTVNSIETRLAVIETSRERSV